MATEQAAAEIPRRVSPRVSPMTRISERSAGGTQWTQAFRTICVIREIRGKKTVWGETIVSA